MFRKIAKAVSAFVGSSYAFMFALLVIITWAILGPIYNYSNTWQLVINTGTTIVTFLMVFLIQNTQNRETKAMNLKLDELIRSTTKAHNTIMAAEEFEDEKLETLEEEYNKMANKT
ncbi:low affinity iron permease family protein [Candidatus Dojkabacteria bacterium]|nr:low affinity iron permease family protein [Candidatus Dojkabacteria bacterium]